MAKPRPARLLRLVPFLIGGAVLAAVPEPSPPSGARSLVVISIDGLRPDYVREADRYGLRIPELRRLLREGTSARSVTGVLPTVTYPSHATLVTGVRPAKHGILANHPFDPEGRNRDGWYWYAEDFRVPTLWDAATAAGLAVGNVDWPTTVGARIRWSVPQVWRADTADDSKLLRAVSSPGLLAEAEAVLGPYPTGSKGGLDQDRRKAAFSDWLLRTRKPRLHFAYFASLDEEQHRSGPGSPGTLRTLEELDRQVGTLRRAAESWSSPTLAVVSDHGFAPAAPDLDLEGALRAEGLVEVDRAGRTRSWRAQSWRSGATAAIVLRDPRDEDARRLVGGLLVRLAASGAPIDRVLSAEDAAERGGCPGASFVVALRPRASASAAVIPGADGPQREGGHGYLPEHPDMDAAFLIAGPDVPAGRDLGRIHMEDVAPTLAGRLGLSLREAEGGDLLGRRATVADQGAQASASTPGSRK